MDDRDSNWVSGNPVWEKQHSRILEAASHLFLAHGFAGTTMKGVARFSGCSVGHIYKHFSGKQDLLNVLLTSILDALEGIRHRARVEEGLTGLDCLKLELELICDHLVDRRALIPIFAERESNQSGELRQRIMQQHREDIALLDAARTAEEILDIDPAILMTVIDAVVWALFKDLAQTQRRKVFLTIPDTIDRLVFTSLRRQVEVDTGKDLLQA